MFLSIVALPCATTTSCRSSLVSQKENANGARATSTFAARASLSTILASSPMTTTSTSSTMKSAFVVRPTFFSARAPVAARQIHARAQAEGSQDSTEERGYVFCWAKEKEKRDKKGGKEDSDRGFFFSALFFLFFLPSQTPFFFVKSKT